MTKITHKLAQRYLRMDLDGLLSPTQHADLETHLRDCESCRAESEAFATLTTRLPAEFHARWDAHDGPSKQVLTNIQSQTRRIIMQKRVDFVFNLLGGAAALLLLFFVVSSVVAQLQKKSAASNGNQTATPVSLSEGKLIAFVSKQTGNNDIYTMNSDGSNVINLTNNPADDNFPVWSPDGMRIAFISNRDGNENIYVMIFDGSGLTRITDDTGQDTNPLWSPDGTKIAYQSGTYSNPINTNIYVVDADGQNKKRLTNYLPNTTVWPNTWSPDGQFILFEVNRQIVQIGIRDDSITPLTSPAEYDISISSKFILSANDSKLIYLSECDQRERGSSGFCQTVNSINRYSSTAETQGTLRIQNVCELKDTSNTLAYFGRTLWSPDRTKIIFVFLCEGHRGFFYIANADGSDFRPLTNDPILNITTNFDWSYDSQSIVFASASNDSTHGNLYTLNINATLANPNIRPTPLNTSATQVSWLYWQPVPNYEAVNIPTPQPDKASSNDRLIAFTSEKDGNAEIYTMKPDGSDLKNLTNNPLAKDVNPVWSPDGKRIAYESELNGFMQIYLMNADGTHATQLTSDQTNHTLGGQSNAGLNLWSPDGKQLLITQQSKESGQWILYSLNIETGEKVQLFNQPATFWNPAWSPDGKHVAFIANETQSPTLSRLYIVDADGNNPRDITSALPSNETLDYFQHNFYWSLDGQSIFFFASNVTSPTQNGSGGESNIAYNWKSYEFNPDSNTLVLNASTRSPIGGWWQGTYFVMPFGNSVWNWVEPNGKVNSANPMKNCQKPGNAQQYKQSPNGNVVIGASCANSDWWLFEMDPSGTNFLPLLSSPISAPDGGMEFSWSGDDKFLAVTMTTPTKTDMYILNVAESQKDPSIQPIKVSIGGDQLFYTGVWQPGANNDVVEVDSTSTPIFRFGNPVETKEQALIAAHAPLTGNFDYVEPPVVITAKQGSPEEFSKWAGSSSPPPKQVWVIVYFNKAWRSTFTASSSFAYNEQEVTVTIPPEMRTPPPPFRGCVVVVIDASNGHPVSVGGLPQGVIPECDQ
jgi:Tol biopolymer transport system component